MAKPDLSGYNYGAISSLVLTPDRHNLPRNDKEPDGAPTSLVGKIDARQMGSRVQRQAPQDLDKKRKKAAEKQDVSERQLSKRRTAETGFGYTDIIEATQDVEGLTYRPRTAETREVYELILSNVHQTLGDQAQDIVRSAADTVLESLKNENMKDFDKKKEVEDILGPITNDTFSQLVNLSKKITDYGADDEMAVDPDMERKDAEIDDEVGVAVIIDEEEPEDDEDEGFEIREESDEENEDDVAEDDVPSPEDGGEEGLTIGGGSSGRRKTRTEVDKDIVSPHTVDGFWVQRQIAEVYSDPTTSTEKTSQVMTVLGSESNLRDCENQLMEIFEYQSFHIITKLLKNRDVIVWCTKLMRSDADERVNVEVAMRERGLGWILKELAGDRQAKARPDAMDVDEEKPTVPKTATLAPGSTVQPKRTVDLEGMAFSQGGHLMSNKKCKLPEGSFKRAKKGYEEIHVPAPKQKDVAPGDLVPISQLPEWARGAFPGTKSLNRIQSKLYPVAFGTDEPILLCAPTGAGKVRYAFRFLCLYSLTPIYRLT